MNIVKLFVPKSKPMCILCRERYPKSQVYYESGGLCICGRCYEGIDKFSSPAAFKKENNLKFHICALPYGGMMRKAFKRFKFNGEWAYKDIFSQILYECLKSFWQDGDFDMIIPVPLSAERMKERGYNQSECLAKYAAEKVNVPCPTDILLRTRHTERQSELDAKTRISNVRGAFWADAEKVKGKKILLVDDIYTMGATMHECADTLRAAGAAEVAGLTLFKTVSLYDNEKSYEYDFNKNFEKA